MECKVTTREQHGDKMGVVSLGTGVCLKFHFCVLKAYPSAWIRFIPESKPRKGLLSMKICFRFRACAPPFQRCNVSLFFFLEECFLFFVVLVLFFSVQYQPWVGGCQCMWESTWLHQEFLLHEWEEWRKNSHQHIFFQPI